MKLTDYDHTVVEYNSAKKNFIQNMESTLEGISNLAIKAYKLSQHERLFEQILNDGPLPRIWTVMTKAQQLTTTRTWNKICKT